jgi:hypothetical protein
MTQVEMTYTEVKSEMKNRKSHRDDLLQAFIREGQLTTGQVFAVAGTGASCRIKELKRKGYIIVATRVGVGKWIYSYLGNRNDDDGTNVSVID